MIRLSSRNAWQDFTKDEAVIRPRLMNSIRPSISLSAKRRKRRMKKLRALGLSHKEVSAFIAEAKPTVELESILANLASRGLSDYVKLDYLVIRGLAYYTGTVFEAFDTKGELRAIAGGGRYDNLVKLISGGQADLPALGFGMGDVVLLELLKARELLPEFVAHVDASA